MPPELIHVRPAPALRRDFAAWAVAQVPKIRTVSTSTFAVPAPLFTDVPEPLLIGSIVDGHRYISPDEDDGQEQHEPAVEVTELVGVLQAEAAPSGWLPEAPAEAYPPDAQPLGQPDFAPLDDAPEDDGDESDRTADDGKPTCADCGRPFKSDRALASHRRQAHPED
ncbi:hypothetical protein PV387_03410 [Streptomyces sp. ME02-6987-2C]|uniref:hypothetical protein n=1 Tax=unclassified Streptomyces TaxID=2593676 RepID=UPI0029A43966|nr:MULTISPECIES: hypothetical protein [unclassified Streptomyces]MDX3345887.1 hypothetical protein [Streptomyces sp. ME02-6979A]MDX3365082.1 hypothetical protein [Streptomyces sp. ME02-6987-2C]MDX3404863.1 hypothetical protein [Streptomyces sp. ME02-6977A]MDX3421653.1 hypothetical protein [Streptomyces sp. ME02-6985-2c]